MPRNRTTALASVGGLRRGRRGGRRGRSDPPGDALARLLPALLAIPILFLLVRYRVAVTRALIDLVNALENAGAPTQSPASLSAAPTPPSAPIAAPQRPPATLPAAPTPPGALAASTAEAADTTDPAEVAERDTIAAAPAADTAALDEGADSVPGDGLRTCPDGFPIKGNATSKIYHLPGTSYYTVTRATICFRSPEAAERAGFRASKSSPIRSAAPTEETTR